MNIDFEQLFETHFSKIFNYILFRVGDRVVAEDLSSETFLRAMSYSQNYDSAKSSQHTWLHAIAKNVVNDYISKSSKVLTTELDASLPAMTDIHSEIEAAELKCRLAELIFALPEKQKELVTMYYTLGMSKREIAKEMDMTVSNVGVSIHRIVNGLRKQLVEYM